MANQKRFEVVKFTIEQANLVIELINARIMGLQADGITANNAAEYVMLQESFKAFTNK